MFQVYLLSILLNTIAGLILISVGSNNNKDVLKYDADLIDSVAEEKKSRKKNTIKKVETTISSNELFSNQMFRLVIGILTVFIGFIKFFVVVKSGVIIFGDFFPAVAGIIGGFGVLFSYYKEKTSPENIPEVMENIFVKNITLIGFVTIIVAVLHFIFPTALFI